MTRFTVLKRIQTYDSKFSCEVNRTGLTQDEALNLLKLYFQVIKTSESYIDLQLITDMEEYYDVFSTYNGGFKEIGVISADNHKKLQYIGYVAIPSSELNRYITAWEK